MTCYMLNIAKFKILEDMLSTEDSKAMSLAKVLCLFLILIFLKSSKLVLR